MMSLMILNIFLEIDVDLWGGAGSLNMYESVHTKQLCRTTVATDTGQTNWWSFDLFYQLFKILHEANAEKLRQ